MASAGLSDGYITVQLHLGSPSGVKTKRAESNELAADKNADPGLTKVVIDTFRNEIKPVKVHQNAVRTRFNNMTLAWGEGGERLVNNSRWEKIRPELDTSKVQSQKLYSEFLDALPGHIERCSQPGVLGDLFDKKDFKTREDLAGKWKFYYDTGTVPDADRDVRAGWSPQQVSRMRASWKEQEDRNTKEVVKAVTLRVQTGLERISDRMDKYNGTKVGSFTDSIIENVRDLASMLPEFNITNDPELEAIHQQILRDICPLDPKELRKSETLRKEAKSKADTLLERVGSFGK